MKSEKMIARIIGIFFLFGFAGIITVALSKPILDSPDYLLKISEYQSKILLAVFFQLVMAIACINIGIWLYPVLIRYNETLAFGAAGFRIIEGLLYFIPMIGMLSLVTLSQEYINVGPTATSYYLISGNLIKTACDITNNIFVLITWCIGAFMYYFVFFQTRLIPRWLSSWGLLGVTITIFSSILVMFRIIKPMSDAQVFMNLPIASQELVLAIWLIIKGFYSAEINRVQ